MGRAIMIIGAGALAVGVIIYSLIECAQSERYAVRAIPKGAWLLVILLLPVVGALLWLFFGRPRNDAAREPARGRGPDDDPQFLRNLEERRQQQERARKLQEWENELKRTGRPPHRHDAAGDNVPEDGTARNEPLDPTDPRLEGRGPEHPNSPERPGNPAEDTGNDPEPPHGGSPSPER